MEYESGMEISLAGFDGHAFACISVKNHVNRQRILLLSKTQLIECIPNANKSGMVFVNDVHLLLGLANIKFNRTQFGVIILQFKSGNVLEYKVKNAGQCADLIKNTMMAIGITGKTKKSKTIMECIDSAEELLKKIKDLELEFSLHPSVQLVQELLDALREVVERFDSVNDQRYATVIKQIQTFLTRDDVIAVLDAHKTKTQQQKLVDNNPPPTSYSAATTSSSVEQPLPSSPPPVHNKDVEIVEEPKTPISMGTATSMSSELKTSSKKKTGSVVVEESTSQEVEELHAMLGDITQEFNDLISSFGDRSGMVSVDENDVSLDDFENLLSGSFLNDKS